MIWEEFVEIIFEHGIVLERISDGWRCATSEKGMSFSTVKQFCSYSGFRPVLVLGFAGKAKYESVIPFNHGRLLDVYRGELSQQASRNALFLMGACLYHLKSLARWYSIFCKDYARFPRIPEANRTVTTDETPYFQFEALIMDVVRGYNVLRYPIWTKWGNKNGVPNSFERALDRAQGIPEELRQVLEERRQVLIRVKEYRDCIQHYVDLGSSSWLMLEKKDDIWKVLARVPDNPERRSEKHFEFQGNRDALTLGWQYITEFFQTVALFYERTDLFQQPHS